MPVDVLELGNLCARSPVFLLRPGPWSRVILTDYVLFDSFSEFVCARDDIHPLLDRPCCILVDESPVEQRNLGFPFVSLRGDPFSDVGFRRDFIRHVIPLLNDAEVLRQSWIPDVICRVASREKPQVVVMVIVDGLSYRDWVGPGQVVPCLVDGRSETKEGTARIVGTPPIVKRLYDLGYRRRLGFSYWSRESNDLTDALFFGFGGGMIHRVRSVSEVVEVLRRDVAPGTYVQVIRTGLDGIAHSHRDRPNTSAAVQDIARDVSELAKACMLSGTHGMVFVAADHGILWVEEILPDAVYHDEPGQPPLRCISTTDSEFYRYEGAWYQFEGSDHALLGELAFRRRFRTNEWGTHGGLSVKESVVPFVTIRF